MYFLFIVIEIGKLKNKLVTKNNNFIKYFLIFLILLFLSFI